MRPVQVLNMTRLFDKEMLIYSFFDIKLKKPARVVFILYFLLLLVIWGVPMFILLPLNPYTAALALGVPIAGASAMSKPIWGGKKFFDFLKCQARYLSSPKIFYDCYSGAKLEDTKIDFDVQISRRRDYQKLVILEQRRIEHEKKNQL